MGIFKRFGLLLHGHCAVVANLTISIVMEKASLTD
jgi:hypothetical protein